MIRYLTLTIPLAFLAACNTATDPQDAPGVAQSFAEAQDEYPDITREIFDDYDSDNSGTLSGLEQQQLFSDISSPDGIGGAVAGLDDDT